MTNYWYYILKVSICLVVFYTFYILTLRNYTFFLLNRFYLILGILLSFLLPVLNFSIFKGQSIVVFSNVIQPDMIQPEYDFFQPQILTNHETSVNYSTILTIIYFVGVSVMFFKLLFSIFRIIRISNNSDNYQIDEKKIVKIDSILPFSFFNMIFLPKNENNPMIIKHELAHIRQFHWFDLLIIEIVSVLLWFNPFVILYKNSLKLQHEYLADTSVIKDNNLIEDYLGCMLKHIQVVSGNGLISQFYCKTIKKRIIMLTKNKTSIKYLGVYILVLPMVCLLLYSFTPNSDIKESLTSVMTSDSVDNKKSADVFTPSIYPLDFKKVTMITDWGWRIHPIYKVRKFHPAIDFAIPEGNEILSTAKGVVVKIEAKNKGYGMYIKIKHNEVYSTVYAHLSKISVVEGASVDKGQVIGYSGNTGMSTEPHLHYEVYDNGKDVNPKYFLPQ